MGRAFFEEVFQILKMIVESLPWKTGIATDPLYRKFFDSCRRNHLQESRVETFFGIFVHENILMRTIQIRKFCIDKIENLNIASIIVLN